MSGHPAVQQALRNHYFDSLGLPASHQEDSRWSLEHSRLHRVPSGRRVKFGAIGTGLRASSALPETRTVEFVAANRLPAIYVWRWFVDSGVLMSYRPSSYELWRRAATVDKILRGAQSPPTFRSSSRPDRTGSQPQDGVSAVSSLIAALAGGAIFFANQLPAPVRVGVRLTRCWRELDSNLRFRARAGSILPVRFVTDSLLEGTGFEPPVPPRKRRPSREPPRPTIVVSRDDLCLMTPSSLSVRHLSSATAERPFTRAGPMVRIQFPPAKSLQTISSSAAEPITADDAKN